ncbi:MAG TPA: FHA domain-containing protein [Solirubrobacteraceae bacterium]|nr:FHA domain-containing protein [Solirubrobacteraceae bacterium]
MTSSDTVEVPTITIASGPGAGRSVPVAGELVIGRENVDLILDDDELSRRHAALRVVGEELVIEDLGSLNGTFVNGQRISAATSLHSEDTIRLGTTQLSVSLPVRPPAAAATRFARAVDLDSLSPPAVQPTPEPTAVEPSPPSAAPTADPTPIVDTETTRVRPTPTADPTPIVDTETTRVRPAPPAAGAPTPPPSAPPASAAPRRPWWRSLLFWRR